MTIKREFRRLSDLPNPGNTGQRLSADTPGAGELPDGLCRLDARVAFAAFGEIARAVWASIPAR